MPPIRYAFVDESIDESNIFIVMSPKFIQFCNTCE